MPQRPPSRPPNTPAVPPDQLNGDTPDLSTEERRSIAPDLLLGADLAWEKYKLPLLATVAALVVATVGWGYYQSHQAKVSAAASASLDYAKNAADFQKLIDTYPGTEAAANAYLLLGRAKFDTKDFAGAVQTWQDFSVKFPQHPLVPNALAGEAGALEAQGKLPEARALYQRVATSYQASYAAPLARISEATLLLSQGKREDAKHVYEDVIAAAPKSDASQIAEQGLRMLNTLPVTAGAAGAGAAALGAPPVVASPTGTPVSPAGNPPPSAIPIPAPAAVPPAASPAAAVSPTGSATPAP